MFFSRIFTIIGVLFTTLNLRLSEVRGRDFQRILINKHKRNLLRLPACVDVHTTTPYKPTIVLKLVLQHFLSNTLTDAPKAKENDGKRFVSFILELTCAVRSRTVFVSRECLMLKFQCGRNLGLGLCDEFRWISESKTAVQSDSWCCWMRRKKYLKEE